LFDRLGVQNLTQFNQQPPIKARISAASTKLISRSSWVNSSLAIGAEIFITEAAGNLEVAFNASHHQELLELLWALGQGIKFMRRKRLGTMKSRAPSGVLLRRMGVSNSQENGDRKRSPAKRTIVWWRSVKLCTMRGRRRSGIAQDF
jgi:hypothetical protein